MVLDGVGFVVSALTLVRRHVSTHALYCFGDGRGQNRYWFIRWLPIPTPAVVLGLLAKVRLGGCLDRLPRLGIASATYRVFRRLVDPGAVRAFVYVAVLESLIVRVTQRMVGAVGALVAILLAAKSGGPGAVAGHWRCSPIGAFRKLLGYEYPP